MRHLPLKTEYISRMLKLFRIDFINYNAALCFQVVFLLILFPFESKSQTLLPEKLSSTSRYDMVYDFFQINDSLIVSILSNTPSPIDPSFALAEDSVINTICLTNLNTQHVKKIPLKGNADSLEWVLDGGSFYKNNEFYFVTRKISRTNVSVLGTVETSDLFVYKIVNDTIEKVATLNQTIEAVDVCAFTFINLNGNYIHAYAMPNYIISKFRIVEFDTNGNQIGLSDTLDATILRGIIQDSIDSTYHLFFGDNTNYKLDQNLQIIGHSSSLKEWYTGRYFDLPYFQSGIMDQKLFSGILQASATGDSVCVASARLINDSTVTCIWKKLVVYDPLMPNYDDYAYAIQRNYSNYQNQRFFSYDRKSCLPADGNCISTFKVLKHDTLNNTFWELEFGGDAGYIVSNVLALQDSGCIVVVFRTEQNENQYDAYYVHIDKDGNVTNNFLPLLGGEELVIPVKESFRIYPNPTSDKLTLDNLKLAEKAKQIYVLDMAGKIVLNQAFEKTIDVSHLKSGSYFYQVEDQNGMVHEAKFVKK